MAPFGGLRSLWHRFTRAKVAVVGAQQDSPEQGLPQPEEEGPPSPRAIKGCWQDEDHRASVEITAATKHSPPDGSPSPLGPESEEAGRAFLAQLKPRSATAAAPARRASAPGPTPASASPPPRSRFALETLMQARATAPSPPPASSEIERPRPQLQLPSPHGSSAFAFRARRCSSCVPEAAAAAHVALLSPACNPRSVRHSITGITPPSPTTPPSGDFTRLGATAPTDMFARGSLGTHGVPARLSPIMAGLAGGSHSAPIRKLASVPHAAAVSPLTAAELPLPAVPAMGKSTGLRALLLALHGAKPAAVAARRRRASSCVLPSLSVAQRSAPASGNCNIAGAGAASQRSPPGGSLMAPSFHRAQTCGSTLPLPGPLLVRNVRWFCSSDGAAPDGADGQSPGYRWAPYEEADGAQSPFAPSVEQRASAGAALAARAAEYEAVARKDGSLAKLMQQVSAFKDDFHKASEGQQAAEGDDGLMLLDEEESITGLA